MQSESHGLGKKGSRTAPLFPLLPLESTPSRSSLVPLDRVSFLSSLFPLVSLPSRVSSLSCLFPLVSLPSPPSRVSSLSSLSSASSPSSSTKRARSFPPPPPPCSPFQVPPQRPSRWHRVIQLHKSSSVPPEPVESRLLPPTVSIIVINSGISASVTTAAN
ncbi:hypothetical protein BJ875DRAFT_261258 [Amylocarpus encephaloides]|uniref:Uncharacterized protein n=1 Tax=Amylocarpus encephaloides TaxID=45428 RepID=A0A9P7YSI7_9HELO|nr:hypothetical protein BJ875DRAFT_261258 [Amylocarpus encephaloides]